MYLWIKWIMEQCYLDSIAVSVFVVDVELTNTETAAATPPTVMQKK